MTTPEEKKEPLFLTQPKRQTYSIIFLDIVRVRDTFSSEEAASVH